MKSKKTDEANAKANKAEEANEATHEAKSDDTKEAKNGMDADADLLQGPFRMHRRSKPADKKEPLPFGLVMTYGVKSPSPSKGSSRRL